MTSNSTFPYLSHEDIISFLTNDNQDAPVTLAQLKTPSRESTTAIFEFILREQMDLDIEQQFNMPFNLLTNTEYPDAFPEMRLLRFYGLMQTVMESALYSDFRITDLTEPVAARLRKQLSALINFILYMHKIEDDYTEEVCTEGHRIRERSARLQREQNETKAAIQRRAKEEQELQTDLVAVKESLEAQTVVMNQRHQQKEALQAQVRRVKADLAAIESQLQTLAVQHAERNEANKVLEMQVVGSPDKARDKLNAVKAELEASEEQAKAALVRRQELNHMRTDLEQKELLCQQLQTKMSAVSELCTKQTETDGKIKDVTSETTALRQSQDENNAALRQLEKKCEMINESRESQLLKRSQYSAERQQELQTRNSTAQHLNGQLSETQQLTQQLQHNEQLVDEQLQQLQSQHRADMDQLQAQEHDIRKSVAKMTADFYSDMEKMTATQEQFDQLRAVIAKHEKDA